jgi:hypothetical protein
MLSYLPAVMFQLLLVEWLVLMSLCLDLPLPFAKVYLSCLQVTNQPRQFKSRQLRSQVRRGIDVSPNFCYDFLVRCACQSQQFGLQLVWLFPLPMELPVGHLLNGGQLLGLERGQEISNWRLLFIANKCLQILQFKIITH